MATSQSSRSRILVVGAFDALLLIGSIAGVVVVSSDDSATAVASTTIITAPVASATALRGSTHVSISR